MSKLKNYIMDIEDQVFALDLEEIITEADTVEMPADAALESVSDKTYRRLCRVLTP